MYDVIIIGAGVTGSSIARQLSRYNASVCVLEKCEDEDKYRFFFLQRVGGWCEPIVDKLITYHFRAGGLKLFSE